MKYDLKTNDLIWWWEDEECIRVSPYFTKHEWATIWFMEFQDNGFKEKKEWRID